MYILFSFVYITSNILEQKEFQEIEKQPQPKDTPFSLSLIKKKEIKKIHPKN